MKRIRRSRAARVVSWLLTAAMSMPLLLALAPGAVAQAAQGTMQTVIVVDFQNKSGFMGDALARRATDAVALELANSARFEVLRRDEVDRQANELGIRRPYDAVAATKIAQALGAQSIVTGEVAFVKPGPAKGPKTTSVGVKVRVLESSTGDVVNGAAQVADSVVRAGVSDNESMAQEALDRACLLAVRQVLSYNLPEGTVVSTVGAGAQGTSLDVLVNRGSRDGVAEGMQFIVLRDRMRVGRLVVTSVFPADSQCRASENILGIRPEDKARAVFPMPDFPKAGGGIVRVAPKNSSATMSKVFGVLVVGGLVAAALGGGKNTSVTGVVAEATVYSGGPAVRIAWRDNMWGGTTLEHQIWRSPDAPYNFQGNPIASKQGEYKYFDQPAPYSFWDGVRGFLRASVNGGTGNNNNNSGNGTAETVTPDANAVLGFTPGRSYTYQVTAVIRRPVNSGGTNNNNNNNNNNNTATEDVGTSAVSSGQVTPINLPLLGPTPSDQAANVDLQKFNPLWMSRTGADVFVVEVSTDRSFTNRNLIAQLPMVYSSAPLVDGVTQTLASMVDLTHNSTLLRDTMFANYVNQVSGAPKPVLYWRVGCRNQGDKPGPVHWLTQSSGDGDRTFRYVYSIIWSFTPADLPPSPP